MSTKKRKISGLSGVELQLAYNSLLKLKETIVYGDSEEPTGSNQLISDDFEEQINAMINMLGSKLDVPGALSFSGVTDETLAKLKITYAGSLVLKSDTKERIAETVSCGENDVWSSPTLYRHLSRLEKLIPRKNETSARAWIDAFFFRASAMLPPNERMVLNMEHAIPATRISPSNLSTLSGFVDYTAVVGNVYAADNFLTTPEFYVLKKDMPSGFFVVEAKPFDISNHIPQAIAEMYACGKSLQKMVLRGALTNGREWIFLLIKFNNDYEGASWQQSKVIQLRIMENLDGTLEALEPWPDLITAILLHWIKNSFADLGSDDWFEQT